ncbi:MAG: phosphatidylglycerol lysyltransferase [Kiritimatiellia bacterium]|jgi:phosphatidylglycerol lysyltransferase
MSFHSVSQRLASVKWPPASKVAPWISLILFLLALKVLHHSFKAYHVQDVLAYLKSIGLDRAGLGFGLLLLNYVVFVGYDLMGLRYAGCSLGLRKVAPVSMLSFAFSNVVRGTIVSGGGIRFRFYTGLGLSTLEIGLVTVAISAAWWLGTLFMCGLSAVAFPDILRAVPALRVHHIGWFGAPLLLVVAAYLVGTRLWTRPVKVFGMSWHLPRFRLALSQLTLSSVDILLSAAILYVLLPASDQLSFLHFCAIFVVGTSLGLLSLVPAGFGVLEVVMVHLLDGYYPAPVVLGAMLAFRVIYYLCPLGLGVLGLGGQEAVRRLRSGDPEVDPVDGRLSRMVPQLLGLGTLTIGLLLLWTGTLPAPKAILKAGLPLGLFEASHFLSSIVGMVLVLLSRGLQTRLRSAYVMTLVLLIAGMVLQVFKGHSPIAAWMMGGVLLSLIPCRPLFHRHRSLRDETFTSGWLLTIGMMVGATVWLILFNYREAEYSSSLWWAFSLKGDAPRALRATSGAAVLLLGFGLWRFFRPHQPAPTTPSEQDRAEVLAICQTAASTHGSLALLGDKHLLFSDDRKSFIMFGVENNSWVVMGDPVGVPEQFPELIWRFREMCNRHGGMPAFYQVGEENFSAYVDAGFSFYKLGEEAIIPLTAFTLQGSANADMRSVHRKLTKLGFVFDRLTRDQVPAALPELKEISDAWMAGKNVGEKRFSIGCFDEAYLKAFEFAIIRDAEGKIMAFANLFPGDGHTELSLDLIRYRPESPNGMMDFLFTCIFLWGQEQGYEQFNLGMAPLSGLEDHQLSPLWHQVGGWIYRHGEHFYNFKGLRSYKGKFNPVWKPKYLATLSGLRLPVVLYNINELISGSLTRSLIRK